MIMEISSVCNYFGDCKEKYISKFEENTPQHNIIKGYICRKPNRFLGSLLITEINGEKVEYFVQSMPKIHYFEDERDMTGHGVAFEKLDGSCLILYPLFNSKDELIEIVPKTRGRAVADKHFIELYNKIDHSNIEWYFEKNNNAVLFFEMYGILNQHEILHYQTGIDIALIGVYKNNHFFKGKSIIDLANKYGFKTPDPIFEIIYREPNNFTVYLKSEKYFKNQKYLNENSLCFPTQMDVLDFIQQQLEALNKAYYENNGRIATEGVVINTTKSNGNQKYIKLKPRDIENKHCNNGGIPRSSITKEVLKYFDEYGSAVKGLYLIDENHHTEYIHRMLKEEYPEEWVNNSAKRIEKVFMQIWDAKQVPESIHNICNELIHEYGDKGITHCMRMFAQKYPMKKKDATTVYRVLEMKGIDK